MLAFSQQDSALGPSALPLSRPTGRAAAPIIKPRGSLFGSAPDSEPKIFVDNLPLPNWRFEANPIDCNTCDPDRFANFDFATSTSTS